MQGGSNQIMQMPGHQVVVQPGINGQPATVTQIPVSAV